ncbi:hypothetical protein [Amnibacterium kyonggiense]|uniref:MinD-like ATPase involved in chromosome partitioning or flagellar assembly n=1 Tax=Amnibacterium kyonggiense TaxID=595671 RepID=A0A4R7FSJ7_9MICO|nr:hypothetical protein [Amnibacterium kyonggiense]TDS80842.1 MinD-like ATPase involved in chromosome partitioning or flagellar assembly [Amnibacterium kyonggiense]
MSGATALLPALLGGAADRQAELEAADRAIRAPLALSRRVGFVQLVGGVGASTTVAAVAALIAVRRRGAVLAVDAAAGPRSLRWHAGLGTTAPPPADARRTRPQSQADALAGLPITDAGVAVLDGHAEDDLAITETAWAEHVAPLARFCPVVCTDWGVRGAGADLGGVAAASSTVCVVTRSDRSALERALAAAEAVRALPNGPDVVVAAVDVGRTGGRLPVGFGADVGVPVVRVPFEPARRALRPVHGADCSSATRAALIRLAAAVMTPGGNRR